jgi:hypothetical protein
MQESRRLINELNANLVQRANEQSAAVHRPDENRAVVPDSHADKPIAPFHMDEHAITRLEAGLRAPEETPRLPHAVPLQPIVGLPPVDEDIHDRSGAPLFYTRPRSLEQEDSLWSTPQQLAMRARLNLYAIAPPVDEEIHHRDRSQKPHGGGWGRTKIIRRILIGILVAVVIGALKQLMWGSGAPRFSAPDISSAFSRTMSSLSHRTSPGVQPQRQNVPAAGENLTTVIVNNKKFDVPKSPENNFVRSSPARCEALKSINQCSAGSKNCAALLKELEDCRAHGL